MDRFIEAFESIADDDLMLCPEHGVAYQRDMTERVPYDESYFNKCLGYEDQAIAIKINAGRIDLVNRHAGVATQVLDVGVGSGEFIKKRPFTFGHDVNPKAVEWLKSWERWSYDFSTFAAFTFWDVIEHVEDPNCYFNQIKPGAFLFTSLPIFSDINRIRGSRHYRPGEHLYYWTESGFVEWMGCYGFELLERADFEIHAGRDSILSFAFQRRDPLRQHG